MYFYKEMDVYSYSPHPSDESSLAVRAGLAAAAYLGLWRSLTKGSHHRDAGQLSTDLGQLSSA